MTTIDKITDILVIILAVIYIVVIIIMVIINLKPLIKPKKYYKIEYIFDDRGKSGAIIKAKTPEKAIRKFIRKFQYGFPLNEITDIVSCTEVNYFKCLKEE